MEASDQARPEEQAGGAGLVAGVARSVPTDPALDASGQGAGRLAASATLPPLPGQRLFEVAPRRAPPGRRYLPLVSVAAALSVGIALDRYGAPKTLAGRIKDELGIRAGANFAIWWVFALAMLLAWWVMWQRQRYRIAAWLVLCTAAFAGAAWHDLRWNVFGKDEVGRFASHDPGPECVDAIALESPESLAAPEPSPLRAIPGSERSRLLVALRAIRDGTQWRPLSGTCRLDVYGPLSGVNAGDRLRVFGQLAQPLPPLNPGEFDFAAHLRADRQLARLRCSLPECVAVLEPGSRWSAARLVDSVRGALKRLVHRYVGPDRAGLAAAILLGAREGLPSDQTELYLVTGIVHVLVVSGMNVAILVFGLLALVRVGWLSRRAGLFVVIAVIVAYALIVEVHPPVMRATVFASLMCWATWMGRRSLSLNSLAAAALVVLAINPADLFRAGPQLSFLAVATLIGIGNRGGVVPSGPSKWVDRPFAVDQPWFVHLWARCGRIVGWFGKPPDQLERIIDAARPAYARRLSQCGATIVWLILASAAVWMVTLPLVTMNFHIASPVSVLISPAVWLCVLVAMWTGFAMLTLGAVVPPLGWLFGALCNLSLGGLERVVTWAGSLPAGHFWVPGPAWWWVLSFYLGLASLLAWGRNIVPTRWQVAALCGWILVGLIPPAVHQLSRGELVCSFVAVGHGACIVLETPSGETLLYDAGALGDPEFATQSIASFLWHRGIMHLDGIVISHADTDHYNAVPGLLERFHVGAVYVSPVMFDDFGDKQGDAGPGVLRAAIQSAAVPIREIWTGDHLRIDPMVRIEVIHPPRNGVLGNDNANSVTLAVEYGGRRLLLPGDLEAIGLADVIAELPYDCDILLAPHHGSRQSNPPGFAGWSTPDWVVISGSRNDDVAPASETYHSAGARVLKTFEQGAVQFFVTPDDVRVATPCRDRLH